MMGDNKILFWVKEFPKVSETFIRDQIIGLIDHGAAVFIFTPNKRGGKELKALSGFEQYALMDRVISPGSLLHGNKFIRLLQAFGIVFKAIFTKRRGYYIRSLKTKKYGAFSKNLNLFFLVHFVLKNNIKIIHAHYGPVGNQAAILKEIGLPIKLFTTFHGFDIRKGLEQPESGIYNRLFSQANGVFAIADYNRSSLVSMGLVQHKIINLPNAINTALYVHNREQIKPPVSLLSVGRLVPEKAYHIALSALAKFKLENPEYSWHYNIVGDGELKTQLQVQVQELGLSSHVQFFGALPSVEVIAHYKNAHLFLLSSVAEVLPTVLLEAQASGLVCLATRVGGVPEMLENHGFLANSNSVDSFYKTLVMAFSKQQQWLDLGAKAKAHVQAHHNAKAHIKQLIQYYKSL